MSKHHTTKDGAQAPDFPIEAQDDAASARAKAALRWKAVVVLNSSSLPASAKCVGIALISMMDAASRECRASNERIGDYGRLSLASVKRGKVELRAAGYLHWVYPDGPTGTCLFRFDYQRIEREASAHRDFCKSRAEVRHLRAESRRQAAIESLGASFDGTTDDEASRLKVEPNRDDDAPKSAPRLLGPNRAHVRLKTVPCSAQIGTAPGAELSPYSSPSLSSLVLPISDTMNRAASHLEGKTQPPPPPPAPPPPGLPSEGAMRLGARAAVICPTLREAWKDDADALASLARMPLDSQLSVSAYLFNRGKTAARQYLDKKVKAMAK